MKGCEPIPDEDGVCSMAFANLVKNRPSISVGHRREHAIHNEVDVWLGAQGPRKHLGAALWFGFDGAAHLEESGVKFSLTKEKIGIAPGDFSGERISPFCVKKCIARRRAISFGFVGDSQVGPEIRETGIERQRYRVGLDSSRC